MKPNTNLETKVGIFLLFGIGIICTLIIFFGEVSDIFKPVYTLTVKFPDASGLLKGSSVYLSGAEVGKVTTDPQPVPDTQKVEVTLKIDKNVHIRTDAQYSIGSSGLLGDRFVEVKPHEYPPETSEEQKAKFVEDGAVIEGAPTASIEDITNGAQPLIEKANDIADQLDEMIRKLNIDVLSGTSTQDLKDTISDLRSMVKNGNEFLSQANDSKGTLGLLVNDRQTGQDLKQAISNLRDLSFNLKKSGVLFYSDVSDKDKPAQSGDTTPGKKH
jgi:phospholipid/cholesterol/gamma-HCH transport system substrate-binding protein